MKKLHWLIGLILAVSFAICVVFIAPDALSRWFYSLLMVCFLVLVRLFLGPTPADRAAALDIMGILVIGFCGIAALVYKRDIYLDIGIAWALQAFIGTLALAKYLEGRSFDD
ncbi:MAG: monovalent cation/H+ antiporter complex subunit F [Elusimicrobiota bacterium]